MADPGRPSYPGLQRVTDRNVYDVLKQTLDLIHLLEVRIDLLEGQAVLRGDDIHAQNLRITGVAAGVDPSDAVNLRQLRAELNAVKKATY